MYPLYNYNLCVLLFLLLKCMLPKAVYNQFVYNNYKDKLFFHNKGILHTQNLKWLLMLELCKHHLSHIQIHIHNNYKFLDSLEDILV